MFNNLVESTTNPPETAKKSMYFGVTSIIYALVLLAVFVWSIFSFDLSAFGQSDDLAINRLVIPAEVPAKAPPLRENSAPKQTTSASNNKQNFDIIKNPVAPIDRSTEPPREISTVKTDATAIRNVPYTIGSKTVLTDGSGLSKERPSSGDSAGIIVKQRNDSAENETVEAPPPPRPIKPEPKKDVVQSKGVVNGFATSLPKPAYPIPAKAVHAGGEVKVQIMIDEKGNVTSAAAISGHPLLRAAATTAAKQAKFKPTLLSEQPVKVTGIIVYNFKTQ